MSTGVNSEIGSVAVDNARGVEAHPGLANGNTNWLRVVSPEPNNICKSELVCSLWVVDHHADKCGKMD